MTDNNNEKPLVFEARIVNKNEIEIKLYTQKLPVLCTALKILSLHIDNAIIGTDLEEKNQLNAKNIIIPPSIKNVLRGKNRILPS